MSKHKISVSPKLWNGYADVLDGFKEWRLWLFLGYQDVRQRYVRSILGPLWLVMGLGVTILGIGLLYGQIFKTAPGQFLPFIAISMAAWNFISATLTDSTSIFQAQASLLKSIAVPYSTIILRNIVKNFIVFLHYIVAVVVTYVIAKFGIDYKILYVIPGLILVCANLFWLCLLFAMVCARFRDMAQIVMYAIQIAMFVTPIIWMPSQVRIGSPYIVYNPVYHIIELIRGPVFDHAFPAQSFLFCSITLVIGLPTALLAFNKYKRYINFWI